jgi:hypothetical protein
MTAPDVNQRLQAAHARLSAAKSALEAAAKAAEAARRFSAAAELDLAGHVRRNEEAASIRAAELTRALKLGAAPAAIKKSPAIAADHLGRLEAQHRADVARQALDGLNGEKTAAETAIAEAQTELRTAARAVIGAEVDAIVAKINDLERQSMTARIELEGAVRSNTLGWGMALGLGDPGKRVAGQNALTDIGVKNAPEWARANESAETWRARYDGLLTNHAARRTRDRAPVATAAKRNKESAPADSRV